MERDLSEATKVVVNTKISPAIMVFFPNQIFAVSVAQVPEILAAIALLERNGYLKVSESSDDFTIFLPTTEESRNTAICTKCGSICRKIETGYTCLNCGLEQ